MLPHSLSKLPFVERFYSHSMLASTSDSARALTDLPKMGIFVIQANRQTKGRGRTGAPYFSDSPGGLWVSIITPIASIGRHFVHNRALSLALCDAIESVSGTKNVCSIKWPNDVYWHDKKLCGILLENHPANESMLVLGFGVNLNIYRDEFPGSLHSIATSVLIETGRRNSRSRLLKTILNNYHANCTGDPAFMHEAYTRRLFGIQRQVEIDGRHGVYEGVEIDGRLRLRTARELIYVLSGHLNFSPPEGA